MSTVKASKGHMVHSYDMYPVTHMSRSKFNRSHSLITTMNASYLVPIWHDLAYPGDTLMISARISQIVPNRNQITCIHSCN